MSTCPPWKHIIENVQEDDLLRVVKENVHLLIPKNIIIDDIVASISYLLGLPYGIGSIDDIDHLGNRRLRSVGELLQNQVRIGMSRLSAWCASAWPSGRQRRQAGRPDQHPPGVRRHQGVLRLLPAVPVHGPAQPPGGIDP